MDRMQSYRAQMTPQREFLYLSYKALDSGGWKDRMGRKEDEQRLQTPRRRLPPTFTTGPYRQKWRVKYWSVTFVESPSNQTQFVGMLFPKPSWTQKGKTSISTIRRR